MKPFDGKCVFDDDHTKTAFKSGLGSKRTAQEESKDESKDIEEANENEEHQERTPVTQIHLSKHLNLSAWC